IDRNYVRAEFFQRKSKIAAILGSFTHAQNSARTDFDSGGFQMFDGLNALVVSVGGANLREEPLRALEIVVVAFKAGCFEAVGDILVFDDAEGSVGPSIATLFQLFEPIANVVQNGPFLQSAPGCNQTQRSDAVGFGFLGRGKNRFGFDEAVA